MATASESPQPLPVPITAVDEKDLITEVPESSYIPEELKKAEAGINGTSEIIESSKNAVILQVLANPVLETVNIASEVHVAKEGESFLESPTIAKIEKEETYREQDYSLAVERSSMAERKMSDDQTQERIKKQEEEEELSSREIRTTAEIKENVEGEESLNIPEGFDTIQTKTEESIPEVEETTKEPLSQQTEIIMNKEAFSDEKPQKVEELSFPEEIDASETKADESVADEQTLNEMPSLSQTVGVSGHALELTTEALCKEEKGTLVTDKGIVTESQKEGEDQTGHVDQCIKHEESVSDQCEELTTTENSSLVKEEISTASVGQNEDSVGLPEVEEGKEKDISAIEEPKESSLQDDDPKVQMLDATLHVSSENLATTDSSEIAKIQELSTDGKEEDNTADNDHINENVIEKDEAIPHLLSDEKTEREELRAAGDSYLTHAPIEDTETERGKLDGVITSSLDEKIHEADKGFNEEDKFEASETCEGKVSLSLVDTHNDVDETTEMISAAPVDSENIGFEGVHCLDDKEKSEFDTTTTNTVEKIEKNEGISYIKEDHGKESEVQEDKALEVCNTDTLVDETSQQSNEVEIAALESNGEDTTDEAYLSGQKNGVKNEVHEEPVISTTDEVAKEQAIESDTSYLSQESTDAETIESFEDNKKEASRLDGEEIKMEVTEEFSVRELAMPTAENPVTNSQNDLADEQQSEKELPEDSDATKVSENIVSRTQEDSEFSEEVSASSLLKQGEIQEEEFVSSAPHEETKFNEELSAQDHPTNLGESSKLVGGDDLESNAGKEFEKPVNQETSTPPGTSTERNVLESEYKEISEKLETREIVSSNLERENDEESSKPKLDELIRDTDDVLTEQRHEGSDKNDNNEEKTAQEKSYTTELHEASAENEIVTKTKASPTVPTDDVVQEHIIHEESSSIEISPRAIMAETIQSSEEVKEDNTMDRTEEVPTCVPMDADIAESTSKPEVTGMPEKDETREFLVQSHISKEDVENVEALNLVLEEKSEAKADDILTNEASREFAVTEKIEVVDGQEESASREIISHDNDTIREVRGSEPDSLTLENAEIIKDELVSQSDPEIKKEELEEVTTQSAVQQSDPRQIIKDESEETETKKDLEELTTDSTKEQREEFQIIKDEPTPLSEKPETIKEELEEVTPKLEKERHSEAIKIVAIEQALQSTESESKHEDIEEETTESGQKQQVEAIITSEPVAQLEETKTEVIEEVKTDSGEEQQIEMIQSIALEQVTQSEEPRTTKEDLGKVPIESAKEQQVEPIQIITNDQTPESEEATKEELEEVTAEEQQSQASQVITHDRIIEPEEPEIKKDPEEITTELTEEQQVEAIIENELISQPEEDNKEKLEEVAGESAKEPQSKATQAITQEQVAQSEEREIKKEDLVEGAIKPAEEQRVEAIIENELISQSEEAKKDELQDVTAKPENEPQSEATAEEAKKEKIEEVTGEPAKEPQSEATQAITQEQVAQSEEREIKKEDLVEGAIKPAEEQRVEAIIENELISQSEEAKKDELQDVTAKPENEPQSEATAEEAKKEKIEEVTGEPAKEPQSEATQAITQEQVAQSEEREIKKEDLVEGAIKPAEEQRVEAIIENELISQSEEAKKDELQDVTAKPENEPQSEATAEEAKKEKLQEVAAEPAKELESEATQAILHEQVAQSEEWEIKKEDLAEGATKQAEEQQVEAIIENELISQSEEAKKDELQEVTAKPENEPQSEATAEEAKKEKLEEETGEPEKKPQSEATQAITQEQVAPSEKLEIKKENYGEGTIELAEERQLEVTTENELISQSEEAKRAKLEEVAADSARETESEANQAIAHEQVGQSGQPKTEKEDIEEGIIKPAEEEELDAIIQNELISQSEEAKKEKPEKVTTESVEEPQSEAIQTITHEQGAQLEESETKKLDLEEGTTEPAQEDHQKTNQVIENEPTAQSEEVKKEELQQVATESAKEQQLEAVQNIACEQVVQSEVPQTKKEDVEEVTTDSAEERKTETVQAIKDESIAQLEELEEDEREHTEVTTESADEQQAEAIQIISREQAAESEQKETKEDLEEKKHDDVATEQDEVATEQDEVATEHDEVATELEGHQSEAIQIVTKEQLDQSDELETEIKGAETVTTESAEESKSEETQSIKNGQVTQSVEPLIKIEHLVPVTTELAEEQMLDTVQINKNEEETREQEPETKTEDLVELPTQSTGEEQFEAREITKKEISAEESAGEKELVQPEEITNEVQQTDDLKPDDFLQKQDVDQQTEGAEEVEATESLKEEIEQTNNETSKHPLLHDDETVPEVQNSEPISSETEKGQLENDEILSEQRREAPLPQATQAEPEKKEDEEKPEEISIVKSDDLEESCEVETIQKLDNLPKETETEVATSEPHQSQEISEVESARTDSLDVSQGEALLELEHGTESTSCMPNEQPSQDMIETERSPDHLEETNLQLEKAEKSCEIEIEVHEQVAQSDETQVQKENPDEVVTKAIQELTEASQTTQNKAIEEIPQEKEMVSDSHQGSPQEEKTHVVQPNDERVSINEEEVQVNLEKQVSVATLEEKEPEGFDEVVGREILKEEIMQEENDGHVSIKEVEVSERSPREILESAQVLDEKEELALKNDEEVSGQQEASSLSDASQRNSNNETGEEKPGDVAILKSYELEENVKLETVEHPNNESNENEIRDSESEPHESFKPTETESAHTSSRDVCHDEKILDSKDDCNTPNEQLPGDVIETNISENYLEVQSRGEIPESAEPEEKKENPEEIVTESVREEKLEATQTTQNLVEEHEKEKEKEMVAEPQEVTVTPPENILEVQESDEGLKEEAEVTLEETDSTTKIEVTGTSQVSSEQIKEESINDELQSHESPVKEADLKQTEEFKTVDSCGDSSKQDLETSDSPDLVTLVAQEDKETLPEPEENGSEKVLKDEVADRDMEFKDVKVEQVIEELELKTSNDSAEEKAVPEESSAKEHLQEEINGSSVANFVVSQELDKQIVTESLKNEVSPGNDSELVSVTAGDREKFPQEVETEEFQVEELNVIPTEEKDAAKTEEKSDFLVQEEDETEVATRTMAVSGIIDEAVTKPSTIPISEEEFLTTDSSKAMDVTSEKAEIISVNAETPSVGRPGMEMPIREEKREADATEVVVDDKPEEKNAEPLKTPSSKEELDSSKEIVETSQSCTVLSENTDTSSHGKPKIDDSVQEADSMDQKGVIELKNVDAVVESTVGEFQFEVDKETCLPPEISSEMKGEIISEDAEAPSVGQPGIKMSIQEEEKREAHTTQVAVDDKPEEKNLEPLTTQSSKEELTETDSSNEIIEMSHSCTVLSEDNQKEVPAKIELNELDIENVHASNLGSEEMAERATDSLLSKQASQEPEGSEEVEGRKTLEKEINREEFARTELLAVNVDNESNKEVRDFEPVSVETLKPTEFNSETEMIKLETCEDLSDKQEASILSEEPKLQSKERAEEKLEELLEEADDLQKERETRGLESRPQDNISATDLTVANAGSQNIVEGKSTSTGPLGDSQDEEILYVGNVKGKVSSVSSEQPSDVIETEITKDSVEDATLLSDYAEKAQGNALQVQSHEEVAKLEYAEIKKEDTEEVTTESTEGEQIEVIPLTKNDNLVEEVVEEEEEVRESHQVSPHEETLKEVQQNDDLQVMEFSEETGKALTKDCIGKEITQEERALKDQLEAYAEDKRTYVFIEDEGQGMKEEDATQNLENKDSLPKLEAEVQLPGTGLEKLCKDTLGTKDEREALITNDEVKPETELGFPAAKLGAEEENAISKAGDDNIGNGLSKTSDEEKQLPTEVIANPERHPDYEKDACTSFKPGDGEIGMKFGLDEKGQDRRAKEPGYSVVNERCPEEMPEKSSQYIQQKPEFDFEKMGEEISKIDTYKAEEQDEVLATERARKLDKFETNASEDAPYEASTETSKDALANLIQKPTPEVAQTSENLSDKERVHCVETAQRDFKTEEEEGEEHKREDSGSDGPVLVEASKDMEVNRSSPHKKHHNILSGVGSKVKHSISKVKKAITGKSSHPKSELPK